MGDLNQRSYVDRIRSRLRGPILEVGSRDYGSTPNFRECFPRELYVGCDMTSGRGVDVVCDITAPLDDVRATLGRDGFGTIILFSVLEHCAQPFRLAENVTQLLAPGGHVVVSAPFVWQIHGYPDDYWRFSPSGIRTLFPRIEFSEEYMSTGARGTLRPLDDQVGRIDLATGLAHTLRSSPRRGLFAALRRAGLVPEGLGEPYVFPATLVHMLGRLN